MFIFQESDNVENVGEIIEIQETPSYSEEIIADCQDEDNSWDWTLLN